MVLYQQRTVALCIIFIKTRVDEIKISGQAEYSLLIFKDLVSIALNTY